MPTMKDRSTPSNAVSPDTIMRVLCLLTLGVRVVDAAAQCGLTPPKVYYIRSKWRLLCEKQLNKQISENIKRGNRINVTENEALVNEQITESENGRINSDEFKESSNEQKVVSMNACERIASRKYELSEMDEPMRAAYLHVLSRVGKCTDDMVRLEKAMGLRR
jgi:hypothetical protein